MPRPPQTYLSGEKMNLKKGGGGIIKMHNIYPCHYSKMATPNLVWERVRRTGGPENPADPSTIGQKSKTTGK